MPKMSYGRLDKKAAVLARLDDTDLEKTSLTMLYVPGPTYALLLVSQPGGNLLAVELKH